MSALFPLAVAVVVPAGILSLASWIRRRPRNGPVLGIDVLMGEIDAYLKAAAQEGLEQVIRDLPAGDAVATLEEMLRRGDEAA